MVAGQEVDESQSAAWLALRDAAYVDQLMPALRLAVKLYFRSEVRVLALLTTMSGGPCSSSRRVVNADTAA